jgi:hypothetical protein
VVVRRQKAAMDGGWNEFVEFLHGCKIQAVLPVINAQKGLKILKGDKRI